MEKMDKMDNQELISALADGQLRGEDFARAVELAAADAAARDAWCSYHLVGEVLRTGRPTGTGIPPEAFLARLQRQLREERATALPVAQPVVVRRAQPAAANDWAWKLAAGVASVAAVAAVGWNMWGGPAATGQPQLAKAAAPAVVEASAAAPMVRDPALDKLLAAHRQFGGATALGTSSGFLRNATFEGPSR